MHILSRAARPLIAAALVALAAGAPALGNTGEGETRLSAWITGYSYWDNTPPGSAAIARPVVHDEAGGTGTWDDPITIAVGRAGSGWHYAPGTRIYLEDLRKYAVVEDLCGACGGGRQGRPHLDLYIGGQGTSARAANACAMKITAVQAIVVNPAPHYPVHEGEVTETCDAL